MAETREDSFISWNATNWITVVLMVSIGFGLLAVAETAVKKMRNNAAK